LKIKRPEQVPTAIFCAVNEDTPNVKPDIDANIDAFANMAKVFGKGFFGRHGHEERKGPHRGGCGWRRRHNEAFQAFCGQGAPASGEPQPNQPNQPEQPNQDQEMDPCHQWRNMKKMWKCHAMQNMGCMPHQNGKTWKSKRGLVTNPQEVLIGHRGQTVFATVTIKNDTQFPYKQGCTLISQYHQGAAFQALKQVIQPIDFPVEGGQEFTLNIPLEVFAQAPFTS